MAVFPIAKVGNPILRKMAKPVDVQRIGSRELQALIENKFDTMVQHNGIGLAAPQVSFSEQIIVMECGGDEGFPRTVMINPKIVFYGPHQMTMVEGCLSIDKLRGEVTRPSMIRVQALDQQGTLHEWEANGLYAVCIQHEIDHLNGKLFIDKMTGMSTLTQSEPDEPTQSL